MIQTEEIGVIHFYVFQNGKKNVIHNLHNYQHLFYALVLRHNMATVGMLFHNIRTTPLIAVLILKL